MARSMSKEARFAPLAAVAENPRRVPNDALGSAATFVRAGKTRCVGLTVQLMSLALNRTTAEQSKIDNQMECAENTPLTLGFFGGCCSGFVSGSGTAHQKSSTPLR